MKTNNLTNDLNLKHILFCFTFWLFTYHASIAQEKAHETCLECHGELVSKAVVHGPSATDCLSCHEPTGVEHNNQVTAGGFKLFATGADMCYSCHTELPEEHNLKYKHKPLKTGDCTGCHNIHSADEPKLLVSKSPDLCLDCHDKFVAKKEKATVVHSPSFETGACESCHAPHGSKIKRLLVKSSKELCLDCHNKLIKREDETIIANIGKHIDNSTHIHKALNKRCSSCHNPHYSERALMLKENFPIGTYAKGVEETFQLCFDCHDVDLLNLEKTTEYTLFRNGEQNLHYLHVNKDKGRNCTTCHDLHAANNAQLIATTVKFGRWDMPLNYLPNDNGGTCATGCHKEQSYAREQD